MDGMQTPSGITECNQSYYAGNSLSVPHFAQQSQHGSSATPAQLPASIQEVNAPASSGVISSSLFSRSAISSQVTEAPTRNGTGGVMPLAEAISQLSILEFLQRFGASIALPQPPQPPVSSSLLDAAVQTTTPCNVSQDVSTQTSDQPDTPLCDVAVRTSFDGASTLSLDAAAQTTSPSTSSQHVSTQIGSRSASSFSVDMSVQISAHRVMQLDAATQLDITEFLIGWIYSDRPLDRRHPFQSPSSILGAHAAPLPPPGLEQPTPLPVIATQPQLHTNVSSSHCLTLQPTASTTHVGTHPVRPAGAKRSASTAHAGNHNSYGPCPRTEVTPFPKPNAVVLPMLNFGHSKTCGPSPVATVDSDIMHHQFRLSLLQWNPGPARRNPTNIVSAACGKFHAVILQEASDHVPHISAYFHAYTDNTDLAILLNKDTFEPDPFVTSFKVDSTSKNTWGMVLLIVRALLRRPSISGTPTVTFCSVHIHNVVAKKRGASTDLLQVLRAKMLEHNVDFIGGDFNMSAFSTVSDVFSDPEFSAPGHSCLWGLGALDEQYRECTGFLIMPKRPYEWRVDSHGCYKIDNSALGLGPRISLLICPSSSTFAIQISLGPIALCEVNRLSKEDLNANATKNVGRDKVLARVLRFAFSLCPCVSRCLLSPNVRSCWFYGAKTTTRRRTLLR